MQLFARLRRTCRHEQSCLALLGHVDDDVGAQHFAQCAAQGEDRKDGLRRRVPPDVRSYHASVRETVSLCGLLGPDRVECLLVQGKEPAGGDPLPRQVVQADRGPAMLDAADRGDAVVERGHPVPITHQNVSSFDLERAVGEVSPPFEVTEHLGQTPIGSGDAIAARNDPGDV